MSKSKKKTSGDGWVFAGASDADAPPVQDNPTHSSDKQRLRLRIEKRKKGKVVTVISELALDADETKALAKKLKSACGVGGTVADGCIELQGNTLDRARNWLAANGWGLA